MATGDYNDIVYRTITGRRGVVQREIKLYESNLAGERRGPLYGAKDIQITMSNYRDYTWEIGFTVEDNRVFQPLTGFVRAEMELTTSGYPTLRFPLGLYRMTSPQGEHGLTTSWKITGKSPEFLLSTDMFLKPFVVFRNSGVLNSVRSVLNGAGVPASRIAFPNTEKVLPADIIFDPFVQASNCFKLAVVNTLLVAGGFNPLQTDALGRFVTSEIELFEDAAPSFFYSDREGLPLTSGGVTLSSERLLTTDSIGDTYDDERFANRIVVISSDSQTPPIMAVAENRRPNSPLSIENLGRIVQPEPITLQAVSGQAEADLIARQELAAASGLFRSLSVSTVPDPRRGLRETGFVRARLENGQTPVNGKWLVTQWTISDEGMTHELSRVDQDYQGDA